VDVQRATLKRQVRDVANGTRNFAMGLRRRMNAMDARTGEGGSQGGRPEVVVAGGADELERPRDSSVDPTEAGADARSEALDNCS
jgi:hypothetical protein